MKRFYALLFLVFAGCTTAQSADERLDIDLGSQATIYRDEYVRRSPVDVHVQPQHHATYTPRVLFLPFRVTQQMENPTIVGYAAARTIWQTWLSLQLYPSMEFTQDSVTPYRRDIAILLARQQGADMVIGGFVTYLYAGGTAGDTQISIQVEAIDANSGQIVWSMAQSALLAASSKKDYALFSVRSRMPSDPLYACTKAIAIDMGVHMQTWIAGPPPKATTLEQMDKNINDTLFPLKNALPPVRSHGNNQPQETML